MEKIYNMSDIVRMHKEGIIPIGRYLIQKLCEEGKIKHHRRPTGKQVKISIPESSLLEYFKGTTENKEEGSSIGFEKI